MPPAARITQALSVGIQARGRPTPARAIHTQRDKGDRGTPGRHLASARRRGGREFPNRVGQASDMSGAVHRVHRQSSWYVIWLESLLTFDAGGGTRSLRPQKAPSERASPESVVLPQDSHSPSVSAAFRQSRR